MVWPRLQHTLGQKPSAARLETQRALSSHGGGEAGAVSNLDRDPGGDPVPDAQSSTVPRESGAWKGRVFTS